MQDCFYPHVRWLTPAARRVCRDWFLPDLELLGWVGTTTSLPALISELRAFPHNQRHHGLLRGVLQMRLSTQRLVAVATEIFESETGK